VDISDGDDFVHMDGRAREFSGKRLEGSENRKDFFHLLARDTNDSRALIGKKANESLGGKNLERFSQGRSRYSEMIAQTRLRDPAPRTELALDDHVTQQHNQLIVKGSAENGRMDGHKEELPTSATPLLPTTARRS
jgi:hypothetical protein